SSLLDAAYATIGPLVPARLAVSTQPHDDPMKLPSALPCKKDLHLLLASCDAIGDREPSRQGLDAGYLGQPFAPARQTKLLNFLAILGICPMDGQFQATPKTGGIPLFLSSGKSHIAISGVVLRFPHASHGTAV